MVWAQEAIAFGEGSSDEMSTPRSPFPPTVSLPTGEFQQLSRGRERGRQVRARRPGQQGPTSSSIRTETTPSTESDPWAWILRSQRSPQAQDSGSARGSRFRTGSSPEKEKERERERFVALYLPCRARHVGLPVPAACFPGRLGYHWSLDCFCPCSGQQGCEPHGGFPLHQSCVFSQLLNMGAAMAAWICIIRYHQLRDLGVGKWFNLLILWTGLLCALGTSVVGNFQQKNQLPTHLTGAFFAFFVGNLYFWMQHLLFWWMKSLPQPGPPWIGPLRLGLCSLCTILMVTMVILHSWPLRSASAACEWAVAMLLFTLFGLFAVDFSGLDGCTLTLRPGPGLSSPPASPISLQIPL
ncbi:modulator of macroautophagy TMEM150B isoform X3 [Lynx canadensis]|uniref:modulator of macroautophagy TMEM150B isoform X3 n=1 Tax=Lynx canadensis TaxID=61383 RepID=UPI0011B02F4A|nr:modulator of macroautophagy TMEM150B isoform X3 [Lynx canadensis]